MNRGLTPKKIVEELNKYISQDEAKNVAISLKIEIEEKYRRWGIKEEITLKI